MSGQQRGLAPELAARLTAARAVLGDFQREGLDALAAGPEPDWASWAHRLCAELRGLLDVLGQAAGADADTGKLDAIRKVLAAFDWERDDRQYALERIDQIAGGAQ